MVCGAVALLVLSLHGWENVNILRETIIEDIRTYFQLERCISSRSRVPGQIEEIGQDNGLIKVLTNRSSIEENTVYFLAQNTHEPPALFPFSLGEEKKRNINTPAR